MLAIGKAKISLVNPKNMESYLIDFTIVDGNFAPLLSLTTSFIYWGVSSANSEHFVH